jgi:hypothetical protein|tara:strand:+ start:316 stop:660 length:345 start_codon:yes stop_codon:yes gene_type:complete
MILKNRQDVIARLIEVPDKGTRAFWKKEMALLKKLESRYSLDFLKNLTFHTKYDSLAVLASKALKETLDRKWQYFNYQPKKDPFDQFMDQGKKFGDDYQKEANKFKNTKKFLNE